MAQSIGWRIQGRAEPDDLERSLSPFLSGCCKTRGSTRRPSWIRNSKRPPLYPSKELHSSCRIFGASCDRRVLIFGKGPSLPIAGRLANPETEVPLQEEINEADLQPTSLESTLWPTWKQGVTQFG